MISDPISDPVLDPVLDLSEIQGHLDGLFGKPLKKGSQKGPKSDIIVSGKGPKSDIFDDFWPFLENQAWFYGHLGGPVQGPITGGPLYHPGYTPKGAISREMAPFPGTPLEGCHRDMSRGWEK